MRYRVHPAAETFDLLDGADYANLRDSIRREGLLEPITLWRDDDGQDWLLDGRNRLRACDEIGIEPRIDYHDGSPFDYAWSINVTRRHLDEGRRVALRLKHDISRGKWESEQAGRRAAANEGRSQSQAGKPRRRNVADNVVGHVLDTLTDSGAQQRERVEYAARKEKEARASIAKEAGVGVVTAQKAITLAKEAPETFESVCKGEVTLNQAYRQVTRGKAIAKINAEPQPLPEGPFRVLVADPPWAYEKRKDDGTHRAALTYPSMTTDEICALPVMGMAHDDAVLWLWTTNAFMRDAFRVLDAWGFGEKTILTWIKDRMGTGDWLRGQTEHCILAVRGKPVLNLTNQTTALRAPLREHSRKPDEFYELVESLCPGSKCELFAREAREGWTVWGAETEKFGAA
jgi:N6-adenosine-specific RNA methylase IME4